jgi:hypothetical protein
MGDLLIAFLAAISASAWVYGKFMRSSGNNTKNSSIAALITGLLVFGAVYIAVGVITGLIDGN